MPKAKSSASSATKKKQARKAEKREEKRNEEELAEEQEDIEEAVENDVDPEEKVENGTSEGAAIQDASTIVKRDAATEKPASSSLSQPPRDKRGKQLKEQVPVQGKQRGEKKVKNKQSKKHKKGEAPPPPRKKQYIPPPKPPKGNADPVDIYGLGVTGTGYERVSAERIVTLRLLNKKDAISVERAMEELLGWITSISSEDHQPQEDLQQVAEVIPVWIHHFPRLSTHVSRRVRLGTANLHAHLLHKGPQALLDYTLPILNAPATLEHEDYLSSLLCAAFDPDRQTRAAATKNWQALQQEHINPADYLREIVSSLNSTILDNSTESTAPLSQSKLAKMDDDARITIQEEQDRQSNQPAASIDAFTYLFDRMCEDTAELYEPILYSDRFWSLLSASVVESAPVRRAVWRTLGRALTTSTASDILESNLRVISRSAVLSGLTERDMNTQNILYEVLVSLLQKYPSAWRLASKDQRQSEEDVEESSSSSSDEEDEEDNTATDEDGTGSAASQGLAKSVQSLLNLLQLGFFGNATAGYRVLPQLLQTLPKNMFRINTANLDLLFSSYWAAYTGCALDTAGPQGLTSFTSCLCELVSMYAPQLARSDHVSVLTDQLHKLWQYYLGVLASPSRSSTLARPSTVEHISQALAALEGAQPGILETVWPQFTATAMSLFDKVTSRLPMLSAGIAILLDSPATQLKEKAVQLEVTAVELATRNLASSDHSAFVRVLLQKDAHSIFSDDKLAKALDDAILQLPLSSFGLTQTYLQARSAAPNQQNAAWEAVCNYLRQALASSGLSALHSLLSAGSDLPPNLPNAQLDAEIEKALQSTLASAQPSVQDVEVLASLVNNPSSLASSSLPASIITRIVQHLENRSYQALHSSSVDQASIGLCLQILQQVDTQLLQNTPTDTPVAALAFEVAFLSSQGEIDTGYIASATVLWQQLSTSSHGLPSRDLAAVIGARLGSYLVDEQCQATPFALVEAISQLETLPEVVHADLWSTFLPDASTISRMASPLYESSVPSILSVVDPLVPLDASEGMADPKQAQLFMRAALAWTAVLTERRSLVTSNNWFLEYSLLLLEFANDRSSMQDDAQMQPTDLSALIAISERLSAYIAAQLSTSFATDWHSMATQTLRKQDYAGSDPAMQILAQVLKGLKQSDSTYRARVLSKSLSMLLRYSDATAGDAERWLALAQGLQSTNFPTCLAVIVAVRDYLYDSPRFHRYQGELANDLSGVQPQQANEKGIPLLRLLIAVAPPSTSERELLPANRAMFLVQTLQKWLTTEDDEIEMEDEVHTLLIQLFVSLVPIIQNLSGTHWDTIFDLLESNIETASWSDLTSLPGLWAACSLLREIRDRAAANRDFAKLVKKPFSRALNLLQDAFVGGAQLPPCTPALRTMEMVSELVASAEDIKVENLPATLRIMSSTKGTAQIAAYYLSHRIIRKATDSLVLLVETRRAQEEDALPAIALPAELLSLVAGGHSTSATAENIESVLLVWLLIFQHFEDITAFIKSSYIEQLRRQDLVGKSLLPTVFSLVEVTDRSRGLDISPWAVEQYNLESLSSQASTTESAHLAAHVYYRALQTVPSLIRAEWESYKNKQYSMATSSFTSKYFSPVLIEREMNRVKEEEAKDTLQDENLTIKILPNVNEVKATYIVDEQPMEISVRIPPDFPLVGVEVREGKRVGVPEATWRAWILNVQLVITTQNGSIADALTLFKANASRHFEGVEACAICYSVISVTDRSLPTKRCRTCKQLFHPSCLYKWFSTSHGSSCPLCRSLF